MSLQLILFYMTKFRLNWSPPFCIALRNIHVSSLYHAMQVKVVVCLGHGTQDFFKPGQPCKSLFAGHSVHVLRQDLLRVIFLNAPLISVVLYV